MLDLAIYCGNDENAITKLALACDLAMAIDDVAQARYLAIYGVTWTPITDGMFEARSARNVKSGTSVEWAL